jgi:hypothetical protein
LQRNPLYLIRPVVTNTSYVGGELQAITGIGTTGVLCCAQGQATLHLYFKWCGGYAVGASVGGGVVSGMQCEQPRDYSGWFLETGASVEALGGSCDIGLRDMPQPYASWLNPLVPPPYGFSGVNEIGGNLGVGWPVKVTFCRYIYLNSVEVPLASCQ